jgi:hypothetical protein
MSVKMVQVYGEDGFISLQDWEPSSDLEDVEIVLAKRFFCWKFQLPTDLKEAMLDFLRHYHTKQNLEFDCYAFVNLVKGVEVHKVPYTLKYWDTKPLPWRLSMGSVVFFQSGESHFHHAAVYIGFGLYVSVWGAGGDLEVATLRSMKRGFCAQRVVLAQPKKGLA